MTWKIESFADVGGNKDEEFLRYLDFPARTAQPFERGLASVKSQVNSLGEEKWSAFKKAFTFGAIVESIREVGTSMVELKRTAEDRGVSTDFLQGFRNATKKFGNTAEDADNALDKLLVKIGEAREQG